MTSAFASADGWKQRRTFELAEGGRGLLIVEAVTDRWGVDPHPDGRGKTVWLECLAKTPGVG
uniref:ATP-binding protein n=1 Tax=Streptomyces sp. TG1A-60 TaxID=3129111 RepID=UPI0040401299